MVKNDIESLFIDKCNIFEYEKYSQGNVTKEREVLKHSNLKCRLSYTTGMLFGKLKSGEEKIDALNLKQTVKLFLPADIEVRAGSKIEVIHHGHKIIFVNSTESAYYGHHTEVLLDNGKEWA